MPRSSHAGGGARFATTISASPRRRKRLRQTVDGFKAADTHEVEITYPLRDHSLPETEVPLPDEFDALVPMNNPGHYRLNVSRRYGGGYSEFCGVSDGFFLNFYDRGYDIPCVMAISAPDILRVRVAADGYSKYSAPGIDPVEMDGPGASIIIEPPGMPEAEGRFAGHNRAVHVYIHRTNLQALYAGREHELPAAVQAFIAGDLDRTVARQLPLGPALLRCLEDLSGEDVHGHGRWILAGLHALEILCHAFTALAQEDEAGSPDISARTTRCVLKAQQILRKNFAAPPSLDDLAEAVGLSRSRLCAGFARILGQSVFDYVTGLRMERALALLNQREIPITQVAYMVGYSHPSSFSQAVQRRFGASPTELRQRGASAM